LILQLQFETDPNMLETDGEITFTIRELEK
jgi:hypothetical protein